MWNLARHGAAGALVLLAGTAGCFFDDDDDGGDDQSGAVVLERIDLVSDQDGRAHRVDPDLVNAWGIAYGPDTAFWIADAGTAKVSIYDRDGAQVAPALALADEATGVVYNPGDDLVISDGQHSAPARFVLATTSGSLIGSSDQVAAGRPIVAHDGTGRGAIYTGLAIRSDALGTMLYAANFAERRVDVFDASFRPIQSVIPMFIDPGLPAGYAPFGIQALDGLIYVTYALQAQADSREAVIGPGLGVVSAFHPAGVFDHRVLTNGLLNAPWAVARAPASFGRFAGTLLIGNFGDGRITAIDETSFRMMGQLDEHGAPIEIDGLRGLVARDEALYFAAGPGEEMHGLFGRIEVTRLQGGDDDDDDDTGDDDTY